MESFDKAGQFIEITSETNKTYKELLKLQSGRGIKKYGKALVSGTKVIPELIRLKPDIINSVLAAPHHDTVLQGLPTHISYIRLKSSLFKTLDVNGTDYPLFVVNLEAIEIFEDNVTHDDVVLFLAFQDPSNVGAVIRSAAAFNVSTIVLLKECANPFHQKSLRAAGSSIFGIHLFRGPSIYDLGDLDRPLIALSMDGTSLRDFDFPERFILLPGLEGEGIPENIDAGFTLSIPISSDVESLNAAVATSVALYEWSFAGSKR